MANYVLIYTGGAMPAGTMPSEAEMKAIMDDWIAWFSKLGSAVVNPGNPFAPAAKIVAPGGSVTDAASATMATGFTILKAASLSEAVEMAKSCPQLKAGGNVGVYETMEVM